MRAEGTALRRRLRWGLMVTGLGLLISCARPGAPASAVPESAFDLSVQLPLAEEIRHGKLDNGFHWFVRPHGSPPGRVQLRLAVDVGSVVERDDQRGFAHAVEHMAFNGTQAYPGTSLVSWLESQGIPFGVHINAHTGFDETVYELQIPTDDPAVVDKAIGVLAQWAAAVTFDPAEVERERGVLIEEWRTSEGVQAQVSEGLLDLLFAGSPYADRAPIGTEASLRSLDAAALKAFYEDWYRPDLMGIVVVGDVDAERIEGVIARTFGDLPARTGPERPRPVLPDRAAPRVSVVADPTAASTTVSVMGRVPDREENSLAAYREWIVGLTVQRIAEDRLRMLNRDSEGAVLRTSLGYGRITPAYSAVSATAVAPDARGALAALEALCVELDRLRTHGVQEPELVRAKREMITVQRQVAARAAGGQTPSGELADELVRHYLTDEPAPDFEEMARMAEVMIAEITTEEASDWLDRHLLPEANRSLQVVVQGEVGPTEAQVIAAYERGFAGEPEKLNDTNVDRPLVADPPDAGRIVQREAISGTEAVRWTLSNGAKVVFERRTTQPGRVIVLGSSPGGLTRIDPVAGIVAMPTARLSGAGDHSALIMAKILAGRDLDVEVDLDSFTESLQAGAGVDELDGLFQLMWLRLAGNRFSADGLVRTKRFLVQALESREAVPESVAQHIMEKRFWQDHPAFVLPTTEQVQAVTLDEARDALSDRLDSIHDWTFVIVGDVTEEQVEPLVARWLGSLPGEPGPPEAVGEGIAHPKGVVFERVVRGQAERANIDIRLHHAIAAPTLEDEAALDAMTGILSVRLREAIREERGGTYVPRVFGQLQRQPEPTWVQTIGFSCDPARVDELRAAVSAELQRMRTEGVTAAEVETQKRLVVQQWEVDQRSFGVWAGRHLQAARLGRPPAQVFAVEETVASITPARVHELAKLVLDESSRVEVLLVPENAAGVE